MNKNTRIMVSSVAAIFVLACACPATSLPTINTQPTTPPFVVPPTQAIPPTQDGFEVPTLPPLEDTNILMSDDFNEFSSRIETTRDETGSSEIKDGVYILRATGDVWNWGKSNSEFSDTIIEVDASMTVGPANNNAGIGIICRMQTREDTSIDGYLLAISADGYYSIRSILAGSMEPLVDWTYSDTIIQGSGHNIIRATCDGNSLILEVNGEQIATAATISGGPESGPMAFSVVSFESAEPTVEVRFDNLVVTAP